MKMIKDKQLPVGVDFAGYPLKEAVCAHQRKKGRIITDSSAPCQHLSTDIGKTSYLIREGGEYGLKTGCRGTRAGG